MVTHGAGPLGDWVVFRILLRHGEAEVILIQLDLIQTSLQNVAIRPRFVVLCRLGELIHVSSDIQLAGFGQQIAEKHPKAFEPMGCKK